MCDIYKVCMNQTHQVFCLYYVDNTSLLSTDKGKRQLKSWSLQTFMERFFFLPVTEESRIQKRDPDSWFQPPVLRSLESAG